MNSSCQVNSIQNSCQQAQCESQPCAVPNGSRHAGSSASVSFAAIATVGSELATCQPVNPAELVTAVAAGAEVPASSSRNVNTSKRSVSFGTVSFKNAASSLSTYGGEKVLLHLSCAGVHPSDCCMQQHEASCCCMPQQLQHRYDA